jgi:hypothetical protein
MQKVLVELFDDLDGKPADETVRFGLGGHEYEIDLRAKNAKELRRAVQPYAEVARKVQGTRGGPARPLARRRHAADIRAWAEEQGHTNSKRGRIPVWIVDEYERAHAT